METANASMLNASAKIMTSNIIDSGKISQGPDKLSECSAKASFYGITRHYSQVSGRFYDSVYRKARGLNGQVDEKR